MESTIEQRVEALKKLGISAEDAAKMILEEQKTRQIEAGQQSSRRGVSKTQVRKTLTIFNIGNDAELDDAAKSVGMTLSSKRFRGFTANKGANAGRYGISAEGSSRWGSKFILYLSDNQGHATTNDLLQSRDRARQEVKDLEEALGVAKEMDELTTKLLEKEFGKEFPAEGADLKK